MAVSKKQLAANRKNAQKSTGPRTEAGKVRSRGNALKHGFYASDDIIVQSVAVDDDKDQYHLLLTSLYEELAPTTIFQEFLVRKIANALWRGRRALIAETANINDQIDSFRSLLANYADIFGVSEDEYEDDPDDESPEQDESDPDDEAPDEDDSDSAVDKLRVRAIPANSTGVHIQRYEMRLDKQISRAYNLLMKLQKADRSQAGDLDETEI